MIDKIQKIKQEIERLKHTDIAYDRSRFMLLLQIEDFIDSLPKENHFEDKSEMVSDDLEEVADKYAENHGFRVPYDGSNKFYDDVDVKASKEGFIAGAEWQRKKDQETIELAEDHAMLAGMMKEREEMMKNAVDAGVYQGLYSKYIKERDDEALANVLKNYNSGDKVKIIIVKTEQQ